MGCLQIELNQRIGQQNEKDVDHVGIEIRSRKATDPPTILDLVNPLLDLYPTLIELAGKPGVSEFLGGSQGPGLTLAICLPGPYQNHVKRNLTAVPRFHFPHPSHFLHLYNPSALIPDLCAFHPTRPLYFR